MDHIKQRGFIPLIFLIPFVVVATGIVGIRSGYFQGISTGFFKFLAPPSPSSLPQYVSQFQQDPVSLPTPEPTARLVGEVQNKAFVYKAPSQTPNSKVEAAIFTISAPSGWVKTAGSELARFESTKIDSEQVNGGTITTNAIIGIKATDSYQNLDDFVDQYKASGSKMRGYRLLGLAVVGNGKSLELRYTITIGKKEVTIHELAYLFFKDGVSFLVKGYSADSAWGSHSGTIKSSLDSFRLN